MAGVELISASLNGSTRQSGGVVLENSIIDFPVRIELDDPSLNSRHVKEINCDTVRQNYSGH